MNIVHVGKFGQVRSNQDEEAISHAFRMLGHQVTDLHESEARSDLASADLLLFHHWDDAEAVRRARPLFPRIACWCFDLIEWPSDPTLERRCEQRVRWMDRILPHVDACFCTDGDWAAKRRESFIQEMRHRWGSRFHHVERGVHGAQLAELIARARVVVAPDSPVTDRYWSNRVYNALGLGAFLMHPSCFELSAANCVLESSASAFVLRPAKAAVLNAATCVSAKAASCVEAKAAIVVRVSPAACVVESAATCAPLKPGIALALSAAS